MVDFQSLYIKVEDFVLDMTVELAHDYLFLTPHFPIFFVIQSLFVSLSVRKAFPKMGWWKSLGIGYSMSMAGRILTAFFTNRRPPVFDNPLYTPVFILIWFMVNCSPVDIVNKLFGSKFIYFLLQMAYSLIQVRESCHGVDIGLRSFPSSITGVILIANILCNTEVFVMMLANGKSRFFGSVALVRNFAITVAYFFITQYPEYFKDYIDTSREFIKIAALGITSVITLIDNLVFGANNSKGIDVTLLTYIHRILPYQGSR